MIVERNLAHPLLLESFEHIILHKCIFERLEDICKLVEIGKKSDLFSDRFYDILFQKALSILPNAPSNDVVLLIKVFGDRQDYLKEFTV